MLVPVAIVAISALLVTPLGTCMAVMIVESAAEGTRLHDPANAAHGVVLVVDANRGGAEYVAAVKSLCRFIREECECPLDDGQWYFTVHPAKWNGRVKLWVLTHSGCDYVRR